MSDYTLKYKPIITIIADDLNINPSSPYFALKNDVMPNISFLWQNYWHNIIEGYASSVDNYISFGTGRYIPNIDERIEALISNNQLESNIELDKLLSHKNQKNDLNSIHILCHIESVSEAKYKLINKLLAEYQIEYIYWHLLISDGCIPDKLISSIGRAIKQIPISKIASISGDKNNYKEIIKAIRGKSKYEAVNVSDYIHDHYLNKYRPSLIAPASVPDALSSISGNRIILLADDIDRYDSKMVKSMSDPVILAQAINDKNENWYCISIDNFSYNNQAITILPKPVIKSTLFDIIDRFDYKAAIINPETLSNKMYYYANGYEAIKYNNILGIESKNNGKRGNLLTQLRQIVDEVSNNTDKEVIFISSDIISQKVKEDDLTEYKKYCIAFDQQVSRIIKYCHDAGGIVILTSLSTTLPENNNGLPLILIAPEFKLNLIKSGIGRDANNDLLLNIIKAKYHVADIAPSLLKLMNISAPNVMTGKSFI